MAIVDLGALVDQSGQYASNNVPLSVSRVVPAGNVLLLHTIAWTNGGPPAANTYSITDSRGNTWTFNGATSNPLGAPAVVIHLHRCRVTTALQIGDVINAKANLAPGTTRHICLEFSGAQYPAVGGNSVGPLVGYNTTSFAFGAQSVPAGAVILGWMHARNALLPSPNALNMALDGSLASRGGHAEFTSLRSNEYGEAVEIFTREVASPISYGPSFTFATPPGAHLQGAWSWLLPDTSSGTSPSGSAVLSAALLPDGRKLTARVNSSSGAITVSRYGSALPETIAATVTIASSGGQAVCIRVRRSGLVDLITVESNTLKHRVSRDQGRNWSVPSTITSGAAGCSFAVWEKRGLLLAAHYDTANTRWMLLVGTLGADGVTVTWGSAQVLVTSAANAGQLLVDVSGTPYFVYITSGGVETLVRCRSLSKAGVGTWS